jgi:hypothetical protein
MYYRELEHGDKSSRDSIIMYLGAAESAARSSYSQLTPFLHDGCLYLHPRKKFFEDVGDVIFEATPEQMQNISAVTSTRMANVPHIGDQSSGLLLAPS